MLSENVIFHEKFAKKLKKSAFRIILIQGAVAEPDKQPDQSLCNHSSSVHLAVYRHNNKDKIWAAKTLTRRVEG